MKSTGLGGPYPLSLEAIHAQTRGARSGAYALGYVDSRGRFCVTYVGSTDEDIQAVLLGCIGTAQHFKLQIYPSPESAFTKACELFHDFRPGGNLLHPDRPKGATWRCPRC